MLGSLLGSITSGLFNARESKNSFERSLSASNTSHQREVADLKAAGLNPVLSAGGQGASTPSSPSASMPDLGATVSNARLQADQRDLLQAQTYKTAQEGRSAKTDADLNEATLGLLKGGARQAGSFLKGMTSALTSGSAKAAKRGRVKAIEFGTGTSNARKYFYE